MKIVSYFFQFDSGDSLWGATFRILYSRACNERQLLGDACSMFLADKREEIKDIAAWYKEQYSIGHARIKLPCDIKAIKLVAPLMPPIIVERCEFEKLLPDFFISNEYFNIFYADDKSPLEELSCEFDKLSPMWEDFVSKNYKCSHNDNKDKKVKIAEHQRIYLKDGESPSFEMEY